MEKYQTNDYLYHHISYLKNKKDAIKKEKFPKNMNVLKTFGLIPNHLLLLLFLCFIFIQIHKLDLLFNYYCLSSLQTQTFVYFKYILLIHFICALG